MVKRRYGLLALLLCILLVVSMQTASLAAGTFDNAPDSSLTIRYTYDKETITGVDFSLYYVADRTDYSIFHWVSPFDKYPLSLDCSKQADWSELAYTLKGYVLRDRIKADAIKMTDLNGEAVFTGLKPGLYLVIGKQVTIDYHTYTCDPFLIALPGLKDNKTYDYNVVASPKCDEDYNPPSEEPKVTSRKALKIWDDKGYESKRPSSITVQLLRDGKIYDTQVLNEKNNWRYTWENLPVDHDWVVVEQEVRGYCTSVSKVGTTLTVTNRYIPPEKPPEDTPPHDNPPEPPVIPQTGLLWWPVPVLLILGVLLLLLGTLRKKYGEDDKTR